MSSAKWRPFGLGLNVLIGVTKSGTPHQICVCDKDRGSTDRRLDGNRQAPGVKLEAELYVYI